MVGSEEKWSQLMKSVRSRIPWRGRAIVNVRLIMVDGELKEWTRPQYQRMEPRNMEGLRMDNHKEADSP